MKLITMEEISKEAWSDFVYDHPKGNIFQTPELYMVYRDTKNYDPLFVCAIDDDGDILGLLTSVVQQEFSGPLGGLSSRCVTWGGPLINNNLEEKDKLDVLDLILKEQNRIAKKKALYMQFRNLWDTTWMRPTFKQNNYEYEERLDILIDITKEEEELWLDMTKNRRKGIKRAMNRGQEFSEFPTNEPLDEFYHTIEETYENVKLPLADMSYFTGAKKYLEPKNMVKFLCVKKDNNLLASRIVLQYKGLIYDWYAGSSEEGKKNYANEFLVWNLLLSGNKKGFKVFDFGGAGKPGVAYGPREFKRRFGGKFVQYGRYHNIFKKTTLKIAKMGMKILRR